MTNSNRYNRRGFLSRIATGAASAGMLGMAGTAFSAFGSNKPAAAVNSKLIYRTLGNTGVKLPVVSMGAMNTDNPNLIRAALDAGIVHIDTAHVYVNGKSEVILGEILKEKPRDSYFLSTKIQPEWDTSEGWGNRKVSSDSTKELYLEHLNTSLKRLQLDYVDILYLHAVNTRETVLTERLLDALTTAKKQGKIRFIGMSFHENFPELIRAAIDSKVYEVILTVYNIQMYGWQEMDQAMAQAAGAGLGIVAMKTMAGGYWDKERQHPINTKAALKWSLKNENICTAIPGMTTFDQLSQNMSVMEDLKLTPEEERDLRMGQDLGLAGIFCIQCRKCVPQCRKGLDIPTLMRSYMYAYGHRNLAVAGETIQHVNIKNEPCIDCNECSVNCTMGFDIKNRVSDIARLKDIPTEFLA
jgi:predicted aldo/keto reductase-like oxidoreductase